MISAMLIAAAASGAQQAIPANFRGTWQEVRHACDLGALHTRLMVDRKSLSDGEFEADILRVRQISNQRFVFDALWDAEDAQSVTYRWSLDPKGRTLTSQVIAGDSTHDGTRRPIRYVRCGATR